MKNYILGAVLALGIILSPTFTQAAGLTSSQINAIISILQSFGADQSVINNVQTALGGTPATGGTQPWCHTFNTNLGIGTQSTEIAALKTALSRSGNDTGTGSSDPSPLFDEYVAAAVVQFQAMYGIRQTGYVGPITRAKLNNLYGCSTLVPVTINPTAPSCLPGMIWNGTSCVPVINPPVNTAPSCLPGMIWNGTSCVPVINPPVNTAPSCLPGMIWSSQTNTCTSTQ